MRVGEAGPQAQDQPKRIETIEDLVPLVDLVGVRWYEVSGERTNGDESQPAEADMTLEVREQHDPGQLEARFRAVVTSSDGRFLADVGMLYRMEEPLDPSPLAVKHFLEAVGIMAAWPFLREAVATTAARMELEVPVLPLMKQGGLVLDDPSADV